MAKLRFSALALGMCAALSVSAFHVGGDNGVDIHGSVQTDMLFPEEDETIGTGTYDKKFLSNSYADINMISRYVDAGLTLTAGECRTST